MKQEGYIDWFISEQIKNIGIQGTIMHYETMRGNMIDAISRVKDREVALGMSEPLQIIDLIIEGIKKKQLRRLDDILRQK